MRRQEIYFFRRMAIVVCLAALAIPPVASAALKDDLVGYWKLDEQSDDAVDLIGGNTLDDVNGVGSAAGWVYHLARHFDNTQTEYLTIPDNSALSVGDIDFTIAAWIKRESTSASFPMIVAKDNIGTSREYGLYYATNLNALYWEASSDGTTTSMSQVAATNFGALSVDTWYFVVVGHNATTNAIFISVNDGAANTTTHNGGVFNGSTSFQIGARNGANTWKGQIGPVFFWKRLLTAPEQTALYNADRGRGPFQIPVVSHFHSITR